MSGVSPAAGQKNCRSDRTGNIIVHRRVRSLWPIGPIAYAPVGERRERIILIISAISACSAVRFFLKMASDFMKFHTRYCKLSANVLKKIFYFIFNRLCENMCKRTTKMADNSVNQVTVGRLWVPSPPGSSKIAAAQLLLQVSSLRSQLE